MSKNNAYWKKINSQQTKCIRRFHNFFKQTLFDQYVDADNTKVLELAAGRGFDLFKHKLAGVKYTLFANKNVDAIQIAKNKYTEQLKNQDFPVDFLEVDLTSNQTLAIEEVMKKSGIDKFDIVSIQFAFHYFLENKKTLDEFFKNIDTHLKPGGYVLITTLDGQKVFGLLSEKKQGETLEFHNPKGDTLFAIKKLYINADESKNANNAKNVKNAENLKKKSFKDLGQKIEVFVHSIGQFHPEYLVNYDYIKKYFTKHNYQVVDEGSFSKFLKNFGQKKKCRLSETELQYSNLHKYLVLQKNK